MLSGGANSKFVCGRGLIILIRIYVLLGFVATVPYINRLSSVVKGHGSINSRARINGFSGFSGFSSSVFSRCYSSSSIAELDKINNEIEILKNLGLNKRNSIIKGKAGVILIVCVVFFLIVNLLLDANLFDLIGLVNNSNSSEFGLGLLPLSIIPTYSRYGYCISGGCFLNMTSKRSYKKPSLDSSSKSTKGSSYAPNLSEGTVRDLVSNHTLDELKAQREENLEELKRSESQLEESIERGDGKLIKELQRELGDWKEYNDDLEEAIKIKEEQLSTETSSEDDDGPEKEGGSGSGPSSGAGGDGPEKGGGSGSGPSSGAGGDGPEKGGGSGSGPSPGPSPGAGGDEGPSSGAGGDEGSSSGGGSSPGEGGGSSNRSVQDIVIELCLMGGGVLEQIIEVASSLPF